MATTNKKSAKPVKKAAPKRPSKPAAKARTGPVPPLAYKGIKTLAFDIGGSGLKASILDEKGEMITPRVRLETPRPCPPKVLLEKFTELTAQLPPFDRVAVGFPGVVRRGRTLAGGDLGGTGWIGHD